MKTYNARFNTGGENLYKQIQFKLIFFDSYISRIESYINKLIVDIQDNNEVERNSLIHRYANYRNDQFNDIYYESIIISVYSFFEKSLFLLCKVLENSQSLKVKDISHKGILKYRLYLEKVVGLNFSEIDPQWKIINCYRELRNYLVHSYENRKISKNLIQSIKQLQGIQLINENSMTEFEFVDKKVLTELLLTSKQILDYLNFEEI